MTQAWLNEAKRLKAKELTYEQIGKQLGLSRTAVWKALNPEAAKRNARRNYRRKRNLY